jgi:hypothetical protein
MSSLPRGKFYETVNGTTHIVDVSHWEHPERWPESSARRWWLAEHTSFSGISTIMPTLQEYLSKH